MTFQKVLVAVDSSAVAARAADVGAELARSLGAQLAFIHAVDPSQGYAPESGVPTAALIALAERDGKRLLEQFQKRAGDVQPALTFATVGKPASEIVNAAKDWPADVIVIGSHGRSGITRVLLGSVAEGVMRHAPCPVLVVRGPE